MPMTTLARRTRTCLVTASAALCVAGSALGAPRRTLLPAGTVIPVKLDQALGSRTSERGDRFSATVRFGRDDSGLPRGTRIEGVVREATPSRKGKPGVLDLDFRRLVMPGGEVHPVEARLTALDVKSIRRTRSGRLVSSNNKGEDRLKFVGMGAGAGLVIAALTKGNVLESTLLGAGAGYLYNELRKDKPGEVNLKAGSQFGVRLDRQVAALADDDYLTDTRRLGAGYSYDDPEDRSRDDYRGGGPDDPYYRRDGSDSRREDPYYQRRDDRLDDGRQHRTSDGGRDIGMLVNDRNIRFDGSGPFIEDDVVYVPIEAVAQAARFDYRYDADAHEISARGGNARLALDSRIAVLNGVRNRMPGPAQMRDGVVYVPMEFVALASGGDVSYDAPSRTVILDTRR